MKKWKIAGLIISQIVLTYLVFIVCIHSPKSTYQQVEEAVGAQESQLRSEESRLYSIIFKHVEQPTSVTIEETRKMSKPDTSRSGLNNLAVDDAEFVRRIVNRK